MKRLLALCTVTALLPVLSAQTCTAPLPPLSVATLTPFQATHYQSEPVPLPMTYQGCGMTLDADLTIPIVVHGMEVSLYDSGIINPNQFGNTATVGLWMTPTSWVGKEHNPTAWPQVGTGMLTVAGPNAHSLITFATGVSLPAGQLGLAIQLLPPTAGPNHGPLHPLVVLPSSAVSSGSTSTPRARRSRRPPTPPASW